ncbi:MAG: hypothetical protein ACRD3V_15885 [Vicinamibacteria bacterium]
MPENTEGLQSGESVRVYPLDSFLLKEDRWLAERNPA